jgi:tripartite-type tricarboxylate transporter receptor subunit TctC
VHIEHVPYRGAGPAMTDLISGHIPMMMQSLTGQAIEMHNAGKLRMLALTSVRRITAAPLIPTVAEAGLPALTSDNFIGVFAPKATPKAIVERIAEATRTALADKELQRFFTNSGFEVELESTPESTRRLLEEEIAKWAPVIKAIGLKLD